jgi:hypothetical protein
LPDISGSSAACSKRTLAARFAQMAISHKSKNAPAGLQVPTAFLSTDPLGFLECAYVRA